MIYLRLRKKLINIRQLYPINEILTRLRENLRGALRDAVLLAALREYKLVSVRGEALALTVRHIRASWGRSAMRAYR